ncbi:transmembrane protease serine 11B-like protein [Cricetulus griseus]|uniref:Transmembrane protease serine 11B-like protein n=1 Tax=Cricetulus griseus TaxID=10029 RepID=A0A061HVT5_CRIGR|nr:transmembrane protease serine 11B-like protein [Cricetulus griseus]
MTPYGRPHPPGGAERIYDRLWACLRPSVATGATDIKTELSYSRAMDPDMALGNSPGPDVTTDPDGSTGLLDQHDPCGGTSFEYRHGHR